MGTTAPVFKGGLRPRILHMMSGRQGPGRIISRTLPGTPTPEAAGEWALPPDFGVIRRAGGDLVQGCLDRQ